MADFLQARMEQELAVPGWVCHHRNFITKLSLGLTEEDAKNSAFVQRHKRYLLF
ncbi:hypothetical protein Pyn_36480 [Prunus yedoensis var. nudiflora]|uniref:Uncharacterized protein n=1 Tax=Prunus yedoensis var. nudiflora TaxID=2094558 RepID=A0A314Y9E8_PRUYE|nr:hypothetical protein Pyn_36480 [Prunus yedoensis var. nudiflora]